MPRLSDGFVGYLALWEVLLKGFRFRLVVTVNALDFFDVLLGALGGAWTVGIPAFVSLNSVPDPIPFYVVFKDAGTELHIIFDLEEVDSFFVGRGAPRGEVNLHNADGIAWGDRKWVGPTLDDHDAGHQKRIKTVFPAAIYDRLGDAVAVPLLDLKPL